MPTQPQSPKKIPWNSLGILFLTYGIFGWTIATSRAPILAWILASVGVFLLAGLLTAPLTNSKKLVEAWFKSDTGAFLSIIIGALSAVVIGTWLHVFASALVLFSAGALARLDIQTSRFKKNQAFWMLAIVSLIGLGAGGALKSLFFQKL